jgi:predicted fused transcriptional regulator/phosphomethylpyrimidine kinase/predicted transcriptional regulator
MKFVEEVVVDAFLPTYRAMLAERLRERGLTQADVADLLGVSQSAVSKYAHGEVEGHPDVKRDERVRALADRVAEGLADGTLSRVGALVEAEVLIRQLEDGDLLARLHEEAVPELAEADATFAVHDAESTLRTSEQVLASVRRGLRQLTNASGFADRIPNVGTNLVEALPDPTGIEDVAAVPGRIVDVSGSATVPGDPAFGVSEHVAGVLLAAREAGSDANAAVNVVYDPGVVADFADAGYRTVQFDTEATDAVATAVAEADLAAGEPFVLYQTGAHGVEPITYVLGPDAPTVARAVVETLLR